MKKLKLTRGKYALVDDDLYEWLSQWEWHVTKAGYAMRSEYQRGSGRKNSKYKYYYMHRVIAEAMPNKQVDHINGNRLDNRRSNLRLCTQSQNNMNMKYRKNKSGYKGVHYDYRKKNPWFAKISANGKQISRYYPTIIEAARGYNELAVIHFGEFARLNKVIE